MGCKKDRQNCNQSRKDSRTDFLREDQTESRWQKRSRKRSGERNRQRNRGHTDRRSCQSGSSGSTDPGSTDPGSPAAKGGFRCRQNERAEDPGCQGDTKNPKRTGDSRNEAALHPRTKPEEGSKRYSKADHHPSETAGNHSDQGKTKETAGAENHTEAYHQDGSPVCEDQRPARAEAPCDQFQRPDEGQRSRRQRKLPCRLPTASAGCRKRQGQGGIPSRQPRPPWKRQRKPCSP